MTAIEIEVALYEHFRFTQNDVITNICLSFGMQECDLIVIRKSLYALEVEIKISVSDLKAERRKYRYGENGYHDSMAGMHCMFKEKWFAMPSTMKSEGLDLIPEYSGLLLVNKHGGVEVAKSPKKLNAKPLTECKRLDLLRLGVMKSYALKQKIIKLINYKKEGLK